MMDRAIDTRAKRRTRLAVSLLVVLALLAAGYAAIAHWSVPRLHVERKKLMIDTVERGTFREAPANDGENVSKGEPAEALLLSRGAFFQKTGGRWAFVLDEDGKKAVKRSIRLGRQNLESFEVLDGLAPGDRVITSSYDTFGDVEELVLE
jgi:hypothetical protein